MLTTIPRLQKYILMGTVERDKLIPDPANRNLRSKHVADLRRNWRDDRCGILLVWRDHLTECYYVIDGQHRLAAAPAAITQIRCEILTGYTKDEAYLVREERERRKRATNTVDRFQFALAANDPKATEIKDFLDMLGLSVSPSRAGTDKNLLYSIGMVRDLWNIDPFSTKAALFTLRKAFPGEALRVGAIHALFRIQQFAAPGYFISDEKWKPRIRIIGQVELANRFNFRLTSKAPSVYYYAVERLLNDPKYPDRINKGLRATAFTLVPLPPQEKK